MSNPKSPNSAEIQIVAIHALIEFDIIERLCSLGQNALDAELNDLHTAMDRDYEAFESDDEEGGYLAHINDEYIEINETLPCFHWYSQYLIAYSYFERALNALSFSFGVQKGTSLSLKDIGGQGIARARTYMAKVCGLETPFELPEWQTAKLLAEIRNAIAHRGGYVDYFPEDKRSLYFRLKEKGIELKRETMGQEDAQIVLTDVFVYDSIKVYRTLLQEIAGFSRDFATPKHGLPSGGDS